MDEAEFWREVRRHGINPRCVSTRGPAYEAHCFRRRGWRRKKYEVYYSERGRTNFLETFDSESEALQCLLGRLLSDAACRMEGPDC